MLLITHHNVCANEEDYEIVEIVTSEFKSKTSMFLFNIKRAIFILIKAINSVNNNHKKVSAWTYE